MPRINAEASAIFSDHRRPAEGFLRLYGHLPEVGRTVADFIEHVREDASHLPEGKQRQSHADPSQRVLRRGLPTGGREAINCAAEIARAGHRQ